MRRGGSDERTPNLGKGPAAIAKGKVCHAVKNPANDWNMFAQEHEYFYIGGFQAEPVTPMPQDTAVLSGEQAGAPVPA